MNSTIGKILGAGLGALAIATLAPAAEASTIIWDYSPAATNTSSGISSWTNEYAGQNFAEIVSFSDPVTVTGMDIYSSPSFGSVGDTVTIHVWSDIAFGPDSPDSLTLELTVTISVIDLDGAGAWGGTGFDNVNRKFANFTTPINLAANTSYWIGMKGLVDIGQASLNTNPGDGKMAQFSGSWFQGLTPIGDMAFRLHGETTAIPEPLTILGAGTAAGFGAFFKSQVNKKQRKEDDKA